MAMQDRTYLSSVNWASRIMDFPSISILIGSPNSIFDSLMPGPRYQYFEFRFRSTMAVWVMDVTH